MPGAHLYVTWRKPFPGPLTGRSVTSLRAQSAQSRTNGASVDPPTRLRGQSAVRVTWPALVADPPAAAPRPRLTTRWTADADPPYGAVPELGVEPPHELTGEQPQLCRPRRGGGSAHQLTARETFRVRVPRELGAHDLRPAAERTADRGALAPSLVPEPPADGRAQRLRVIPALPGRPPWPGIAAWPGNTAQPGYTAQPGIAAQPLGLILPRRAGGGHPRRPHPP